MKSQNATATLGNVTSCQGENVLVPLDVTDFIDVGAMTIYIGYDTNAAEFLSLQNINPTIPGGVAYNTVNGQVIIVYSNMEPFTIYEEKLFDLSFAFLGDSTQIPFKPGTEIANSLLEILPLDTFPGSIENSIVLVDQPDSVQSYPDNDVTFGVTATGDNNYQWQENAGSGWYSLQNNQTYSGVTTETLTIYDVTLDFNGNLYRCVISADECTVISDAALLEVALAFPVATLGSIASCPENVIFVPLSVGDFFDVIEFNFNISFNTASLTFLDLDDIHPDLVQGSISVTPLNSPPGISVHWEDDQPVTINSGVLFDLIFNYEFEDQALAFEAGTFVLNSSSNPVNITLNDGVIEQYYIPVIISQPQDETVMEFDEANFSVEANGAISYTWMQSSDNGSSWTDLADTPPYFNVQTSTLTISPATYNLNGNYYACRLSNENCQVNSEPALLKVDTLTWIVSPEEEDLIRISPVPFRDKIHLDVTAGMTINKVNIFNIQGKNCYGDTYYNIGEQIWKDLDLSFLPAGVYILRIEGSARGKEINEQRKILKTN